MSLFSQERRGTRRADRPLQGIFDRPGFAFLRNDADHFLRGTKRGNRHRKRVRRHGFQIRKVTFNHLLAFAGVVELHDFKGTVVVEIGDGWIIEGQVSVLADAEAAKINRLGAQQLRVTLAFLDRLHCVAFEIMKCARLQPAFNPLTHVPTEARRMIGRNPEVFVHVKERDLRPVHSAELDQLFEELDL